MGEEECRLGRKREYMSEKERTGELVRETGE